MTNTNTNPNQLTEAGEEQTKNLPTRNSPTVTTLTGMMRRFFEAYVAGGMRNATEAARTAGYKHPNKIGPRLLRDHRIQDAIEDTLRAQVMKRDEFLHRLSSQARGEFTEYLRIIEPTINEETGEICDPDTAGLIRLVGPLYLGIGDMLADGKGHLLRDISNGRFGPSIKFTDTQNALIHIGKVYGAFVETTEQKDAVPDAVARLLDEINEQFPVNV